MKYTAEAQFLFVVAVVTNSDGIEEGKRLSVFNYTGKRLLGLNKYNKLVDLEIARVKGLTIE
jgi:hypothetical protein